ncbi:S49 family peptidase [Brucella sp. RRSP16]|uniref:S49 family peptidase n=1 Tax=Brucella sp. RRSP16 TaxID=3453707 RepID=UPI003FCCB61A
MKANTNNRALRAALTEPWAITAEGLELVLSVAARENDVSIDALEAYRAEHVPTAERLTRRGSVGVLDVRGPLVNRANLFTAISGATSYDILRRDLQLALDDPSISAIVMSYDTPGGAVTGVDELAKAIRAGKAIKPIVAYVGGSAASAGYWLASQSTEIVIADTALLGSIGVRAALQDTSKKDAEAGRIEFISSQSPGKRTDLSTDEGRARIQRTIDALAEVFIATVAEGRGVKPDDVIANFGGGDVLIGSAAVAAGMADRIGNFEAVIKELSGRRPTAQRSNGMALSTATADTERTRIHAILSDPLAQDRAKSAHHLAFNTELTADAAISLLQTIPAETAPDAFDSLPEDIARACNAPGGLVLWDAEANALALSDISAGNTGQTLSSLVCSVEHTPDPHAAIRTTPEQKAKSLWQKAIGEINAARGLEG